MRTPHALRLLRIPGHARQWYMNRIGLIQSGQARPWPTLELVCMTLSLATLLLLFITAVAGALSRPLPTWIGGYLLPVMLAGAVGYMTNLIAVTMLFRPFGPEDPHAVGIIPFWKQGLVPRSRRELAEQAGDKVAGDLLKPETIADEVRVLVERALEDPQLQDRLRWGLGPVIREQVPAFASEQMPEILRHLRAMLAGGFSHDSIEEFFGKVVDPWLRHGENKKLVAAEMASFMKGQIPWIMGFLRQMAERYKQSGRWKRASVWFAEKTRALDWEEIEKSIRDGIDDREGRKELLNASGRFISALREQMGSPAAATAFEQFRGRSFDFAAEVIQRHLEKELPALGHRFADDPEFWRWLSQRALPALQPYLLGWLRGDAIEVIRENFDVAGRVRDAIEAKPVEDVHRLINDISAKHLGAIQVLGFVLGLLAGTSLLLI